MSSSSPEACSDFRRSRPPNGLRGNRRRHRTTRSTGSSLYEWSLLVLVALAPCLGVWLFGGVRLWSIGPLMSGVFLAAALCALRYLRPDDCTRPVLPPGLPVLLIFSAYAFLRTPAAAVPYDAWVESLKIASLPAAFWVWVELSGRHGRWRWLVAAFLLVVTAMAWYAIIQHAQGDRGVLNLVRPKDYGMRASGAYFCPNHFANLLDLTIPFAVAVAAARSAGLPLRLLAGYSVLVALPPLYLTQSRSGWIGVMVGTVVTFALLGLRRGWRRCLLLLVVVPLLLAAAGVAVWMLSPMVQARVADALGGNVRLQLWQDSWAMIQDRFWTGWGPYSYRWVYPHYWRYMTSYLDPQYAHNDFIHAWAEYGLAGLLLLAGGLLWAAVRLMLRIRTRDPEREGCLLAGMFGALAATAAHACFDYNFHIYGNVQVLVMLAGITVAVLRSSDPAPALPATRSTRWMAALAVPILILLGCSVRAVSAYGFALKGDFAREVFQLDRAQAAYAQALRIEPRYWPAYLGLGHVWGSRAFWNRDEESRRDQVQRAEDAYRQVGTLNPWDTDARFGLSRLYNLRGEPERALTCLQEVVAQVPYHRDFLNQVGLQLRTMRRYEEALATFQRARSLGANEMADLNIRSLNRLLAQPKAD